MKQAFLGLALAASLVCAQPRHEDRPGEQIILVIATNPAFPGGVILGTNLAIIEAEAVAMASLDPLCGLIPQLCEARAAATVFSVIYADGSETSF